jgi:ABC-2 type transport system permease protein
MSATWRQVAHKDFADAVRSKMVWGIIAVFVGFVGFVLAVVATNVDGAAESGDAAIGLAAQLGQLFIPMTALVVAYMAIVGERRSGSLKVLLSYPFSRFDVVFGKLLGRSAVIAVTMVAGFVGAAAVGALLFGSFALDEFAVLIGLSVLFGLAFVGIAVGISAATATRGKAMALAIGTFFVFLLIWHGVAAGVYAAVAGGMPGLEVEAWYFLLKRLSPIEAYHVAADSILGGEVHSLVQLPVEDVPADATPEQLKLANRVPGDLPFYLTDWFAGVTLAAWTVVPPALGYLRFRGADLG